MADLGSMESVPKFTFAEALGRLLEGKRVARAGWNGWSTGKTFAVVRQKGYPDGIEINANTSEALGLPEKTLVKFAPYLMLCVGTLPTGEGDAAPVDRTCLPWTPSQQDQLAEDWIQVA